MAAEKPTAAKVVSARHSLEPRTCSHPTDKACNEVSD